MHFDRGLIRETEKECRKEKITKANRTVDAIEKMLDTDGNSVERRKAKHELVKALLRK